MQALGRPGIAHETLPQTMQVSPVVIDYTFVHIAFPSTVTLFFWTNSTSDQLEKEGKECDFFKEFI